MTKINGTLRRFAFAAFMLFAAWIFTQFTGCSDSCLSRVYVMENGVRCKRYADPVVGTDSYRARVYLDCDDGKMYRDARNVAYYCEKQE